MRHPFVRGGLQRRTPKAMRSFCANQYSAAAAGVGSSKINAKCQCPSGRTCLLAVFGLVARPRHTAEGHSQRSVCRFQRIACRGLILVHWVKQVRCTYLVAHFFISTCKQAPQADGLRCVVRLCLWQ